MLTNRVGMMLDDRVKYDVKFTEASVECFWYANNRISWEKNRIWGLNVNINLYTSNIIKIATKSWWSSERKPSRVQKHLLCMNFVTDINTNIMPTRFVSIFKSSHHLNYSFLTSTKQGSRNRHWIPSSFWVSARSIQRKIAFWSTSK